MINARELLDAMVNANATRQGAPDNAQRSFLQDALEAFGGSRTGAGGILGQVLGQATGGLADMARHPNAREAMGGQSVEDLARRAQEMMGRNPGIAKAALVGAAGLLLGTRGGRGMREISQAGRARADQRIGLSRVPQLSVGRAAARPRPAGKSGACARRAAPRPVGCDR